MFSAHRRPAVACLGQLFEALEQRQLMSVVHWDGGGDGTTLMDPLNWAGDVLPGPADDAVVDVVGTPTIEHSIGVLELRSLTMRERFNMYGGRIEIELN